MTPSRKCSGGRLRSRLAAAGLALAATLGPGATLAQQGMFPGTDPSRPGGVAPTGPSPSDKAAAAAANKQIAQEIIDKQRDEAASLKAREDRRALRERLEHDASLLRQPLDLLERLFLLPAELPLSADHRAAAESVLGPHRERIKAAWPGWVAEESAQGTGKLAAETVSQRLSNRALNEAALWQADAAPQASDTIWLEALKRPELCRRVDQPLPAAQVAQLIEALPAEQRAAAWQGEAERLARWGQKQRTTLPATERVLEDTLLAALPTLTGAASTPSLAPALRDALRAPGWAFAAQPASLRCELLRWWSQEQVRTKRLAPLQALRAWRTAMAVRSTAMLYPDIPRSGPKAVDAGGYPVAARRAEITGKVVVEQDLDAGGKILRAFIQRREIQAAGVRDVPALALERELDDATLARVRATPTVAPDPAQLRDGTVTRRVAFEWVLQ